jgi:hypothetical protein
MSGPLELDEHGRLVSHNPPIVPRRDPIHVSRCDFPAAPIFVLDM